MARRAYQTSICLLGNHLCRGHGGRSARRGLQCPVVPLHGRSRRAGDSAKRRDREQGGPRATAQDGVDRRPRDRAAGGRCLRPRWLPDLGLHRGRGGRWPDRVRYRRYQEGRREAPGGDPDVQRQAGQGDRLRPFPLCVRCRCNGRGQSRCRRLWPPEPERRRDAEPGLGRRARLFSRDQPAPHGPSTAAVQFLSASGRARCLVQPDQSIVGRSGLPAGQPSGRRR